MEIIGEKVLRYGKEFVIDQQFTDSFKGIDTIFVSLSPISKKASRSTLPLVSLLSGRMNACSVSDALMDVVNKETERFNSILSAKSKTEEALRAEQERKAKEEMIAKAKSFREEQANLGREQGIDDARNRKSALYRVFIATGSYLNNVRKSAYSEEFRNAYMTAYENEMTSIKKERLVATRANQSTLDDYPGNLKELISWMRKNLLRIEVFASPDKIDNEQKAIDCINERDNTNYEVKLRQGQYVAYEAFFRNPKSAPQEFIDWMVSKHDYTTADLDKRVMAHPMNIETGKMTCNSIIKELVYSSEYGFHVGKASN